MKKMTHRKSKSCLREKSHKPKRRNRNPQNPRKRSKMTMSAGLELLKYGRSMS